MSVPVIARAILETARVSVPTVLEALWGGGDLETYDARLDSWSRHLLEQADIALAVQGQQHVAIDRAYVLMSNHQSHYDIPVVFQALRRRVRMVTKKELFRVPVWGGAMRRAGFVEVDRKNRAQAMAALGGASQALARGTNIWIAPEGTRSDSGELGAFKKGGFHLALDAEAEILPVSIDGTRHVLRARDWRISRGHTVRVTFGAPIAAADYGEARLDDLMSAVRAAIAGPLARAAP